MGKKKVNKSLEKLRKCLQNKQFLKAMFRLNKMSKQKQSAAIKQASPQFIRDLSHVLSILRNHSELMNAKLRKLIKPHVKSFRKLINKKTSIAKKRLILTQTIGKAPAKAPFSRKRTRPVQKGGVSALAIPLIMGAIGATGATAYLLSNRARS